MVILDKPQRSKGFTLIELLVVISIISLLSSIVLSSLSSIRDKARLTAGKEFSSMLDRDLGSEAVGWWNLDDCTGTSVSDKSGSNATGIISTGISWSPNQGPWPGTCSLSFDGNTYTSLSIPMGTTNPQLVLSGDITVSAWVYLTSYNSWTSAVVRGGTWADEYYGLYVTSGGNVSFNVYDGDWSDPNATVSSTGGEVPLKKWTHIAAVRSGTNIILYVNGSVVTSGTIHAPQIQTPPPQNLGIGGIGYGAALTGNLYGVRVFASTLTLK